MSRATPGKKKDDTCCTRMKDWLDERQGQILCLKKSAFLLIPLGISVTMCALWWVMWSEASEFNDKYHREMKVVHPELSNLVPYAACWPVKVADT